MKKQLLAIAACATLGATAQTHAQTQTQTQTQTQPRQGAEELTRTVRMSDARGNSVGTVELRQLAHGLLITADLRNLPPGPHGFHLHERGVCEAPFQSADGHYNPAGTAHGFDSQGGPHAGDLPNIHVTQQGTAMAEFQSDRVSLGRASPSGSGPYTLLDRDGSAILVHAQADNYQDMDSAGGRIACGVIKAPE